MPTKLSVNINKIATLRNARGGNVPDVIQAARRIESFGADGITVHPRPDERHIRYDDVRRLREVVQTEFNVEGYPTEAFLELVLDVQPDQVTLVPDPPEAITSNAGWDTVANRGLLVEVVSRLKSAGIRTSIFMENKKDWIEAAAGIGADRIELYTESYANAFAEGDHAAAVSQFAMSARWAQAVGLGVNAGHDLNLQNLGYFASHVPNLLEVSIGHALIADALYFGLENAVRMYQNALR